MLRLALCVLGGQVVNAQFGLGGFGDIINSLRSVVPIPSSIPIPSIPTEPSTIVDLIGDVIKGSPLPPFPSIPTVLPSLPAEWDKTIKDIMAGSPLPPALPSDLNGPYLSVLNGSALPGGILPSEYAEMVDNIIHGSPLPADADEYKRDIENMLAGSAMPTRRMPSIPRDIPGMPSIDFGQYQELLNELFNSVRDMFDGVEFQTKDLFKELSAQGFEVPSIDPTRFLENRDEYLAKIREQFQHLAEKMREKGIMDRLKNIRGELSDVLEGKKTFNVSMAEDYLDRMSGIVDPIGRLNSTFQSALRNVSMVDVHDSLRRISSAISQQRDEKFEKATSDFQFISSKMRERAENFVGGRNGSSVQLPPLPFLNQSLTFVEWNGNPYAGILNGKYINSSVVSVMLSDLSSGNETAVRGLEDLINITLPLFNRLSSNDKPECLFWNATEADWSNEGCRVQNILPSSIVCGCNHMTDFAVAIIPLGGASVTVTVTPNPRPLPSTGGVVLIADAGVPQVVNTGKDIRPVIGGVVGGVAGSVLLSIVAANLWDRRKKARLMRKSVISIQNKNPVATMV